MADLSTGEFRKRRDIQADLKLCQKMEEHGQWSPADSFNEQDWTRAVSLYDQLYRVKYPQHSPAYNLKFFQRAHSSRWLEIKGVAQWRWTTGRYRRPVEAPRLAVLPLAGL